MIRPMPSPDRDSAPWWEGVKRHELLLQQCTRCSHLRWPARAICNRCGSLESSWVRSAGTGRVASWIVNHHGFSAAFPTPYTVVAVRLDDQADIIIPGGYDGPADGAGLAIDLPVTVAFEDVVDAGEDRGTLLRWRPSA